MEVTRESVKTNTAINCLAKDTSRMMGLGQRPSSSLHKVLEQEYGVKILYYPLAYGSAASMVHADMGKAVVINANEVPWRQNYDLAHELFHLKDYAEMAQIVSGLETASGYEIISEGVDMADFSAFLNNVYVLF